MLEITHKAVDGRSTVTVAGELDIDTVSYFIKEMETVGSYDSKEIVFDFNGLQFVDSTGVKTLINQLKEMESAKKKVLIINIIEQVYTVLDLVGVVALFGSEHFHKKPL